MAEVTTKEVVVPSEDAWRRLGVTGKVTPTGYTPLNNQTMEQWDRDGEILVLIDHAMHWALGDWLNAGENRFSQEASQAKAMSKKSFDWWQQVRRVAFQVRPENRRRELPWSYHQAVAPLDDMPEQRELLQKAIDEKWDLDDLRAEVALVKNDRTPLEIGQSNEPSAYMAAKGGDVAPPRKLADVAKEAQDAKKAAAILKRQERLDLQDRKRAEVVERKAAIARGEKPPPRGRSSLCLRACFTTRCWPTRGEMRV